MRNKAFWFVTPLTALFVLGGLVLAQATEEAAGQAAEQTGKLREAVTHYVAALQLTPDGSDEDQRLREKIINLVQKLDPPPAIPKEAERFMARGQAAVEIAKGSNDFRNAIDEFQKAARIAPWWADGYYNLGAVYEKMNNYTEAIRNLKLYLLAAPNAQDAKAVDGKVFKLEFKQEQIAKAEAEARKQARDEERRRTAEAAEARRQEERRRGELPMRLAGDWRSQIEDTRLLLFRMEISGSKWELYKIRTASGVSMRVLIGFGSIENGEIRGYAANESEYKSYEGCIVRKGNYPAIMELGNNDTELRLIYEYQCRGATRQGGWPLRR